MSFGRSRSRRNWRPGTVHQVYCRRCGSDQVTWKITHGKYTMIWSESAAVPGGRVHHLDIRHDCHDYNRGGRPCSADDIFDAEGVCTRPAHQTPEQRRRKKAESEAAQRYWAADRARTAQKGQKQIRAEREEWSRQRDQQADQ